MTLKIESKIVGYAVVKETPEGETKLEPMAESPAEGCKHFVDSRCTKPFEPFNLADSLSGNRYRLKSPIHEGSLYMIVMNSRIGGQLRPVEVFFEAKNMNSYPWIKFTARMLSALFRQPGPFPAFVIDEMCQTKAPNGSYFVPGGGGQVESIVHHAGEVLKKHCISLGLLEGKPVLEEAQARYVEKKREELGVGSDSYPDYATVCAKCNEKAVVLMDGCSTCLACSDSKCG